MAMQKKILVTGGAGYIGSHVVVQLLEQGYDVLIYDNFCNSSPVVIDRLQEITNKSFAFVKGDIRDRAAVAKLFSEHDFAALMHFAGLKAVGESEQEPLKYYDVNVSGSIVLFEEMQKAGVNTIVFSSSATVYGDPGATRYVESMPLAPVNTYGHTKRMVEDVLRSMHRANPQWRIALLRYFNPVGAHVSGRIGESPLGIPNNLMPFITQVATGQREKLAVFGNDYPTRDGTGLRDYIHVDDLAAGHLAALRVLADQPDLLTINLGTGHPYSVLEMIAAFEQACGKKIPYQISTRRPGDLPEYFADPTRAKQLLGWQARLDITRMCADSWRWQKNNPKGYAPA